MRDGAIASELGAGSTKYIRPRNFRELYTRIPREQTSPQDHVTPLPLWASNVTRPATTELTPVHIIGSFGTRLCTETASTRALEPDILSFRGMFRVNVKLRALDVSLDVVPRSSKRISTFRRGAAITFRDQWFRTRMNEERRRRVSTTSEFHERALVIHNGTRDGRNRFARVE